MKNPVSDPSSSPIALSPDLGIREALACADTLLKDIYETAETYRIRRPGKSAKALDSVMDSALIAAALLMHVSGQL